MKTIQKTLLLIVFTMLTTVLVMLSGGAFAQLPEQATDVKPLLTGQKIPETNLTDKDGKTVNTKELFKNKPTILVFYRGGWCPYCNKHLSELAAIEEDLKSMGYQVLAISPDAAAELKAATIKDKLGYALYSDSEGLLSRTMGIAYQSPEKYKSLISKSSGGLNKDFLPVPSLFIVSNSGEILFEYINPDYSKRIPADLVKVVAEFYAKSN